MTVLTAAEIHLWLAFFDEIDDQRLHHAYRALMTDAEQAQEGRFYWPRDRRRYLVTRALVRSVLSRYLPVAEADWIFSANAYGRPEVVNAEACQAHLSFNISHTHRLIVLGVTKHRALGVDVESIRAREPSLDIADRFFAAGEVADLGSLAPDRQKYRFFEYWTLKESYIKARGMGLSLPLDKFSFRCTGERGIEFAVHPELEDDAARWQFWQLMPTAEHLVAVCAERLDSARPSLIVRKTVPGVGDEALELPLLRVSR